MAFDGSQLCVWRQSGGKDAVELDEVVMWAKWHNRELKRRLRDAREVANRVY